MMRVDRVVAAGGEQYSYFPDNKRLWKKLPGGAEEVYFYSIAGEKLGTYEPTLVDMTLYLKFKSTNVYYAGTLIRSEGQAVVLDRLGSVRSFGGTAIRYFPYGEEQTSTPNDRQKFGTYYRDASTGLDYANQRYYGSGVARFLTPDPNRGSAGAAQPGSWNRSTYVGSDPVNANDPTGLCMWCAQLEAPPNLDGSGGGIIWRSEAPWGSGWLHDPRFYGPGAISPLSAGINCHFIIRPGEDPYCGIWRITVYADIAAGLAWGVAAATGGGGDGGGGEDMQKTKPRTYFLMVRPDSDCYRVPAKGAVTRDITYLLHYLEEGMLLPMRSTEGVIWEHLSGGLFSPAGPDSPSSGGRGTYDDQHSIAGFGTSSQSGIQRFSAVLSSGLRVQLGIAAFGGTVSSPVRELKVQKFYGYVSISGSIGGRVDQDGMLIRGSYRECPD